MHVFDVSGAAALSDLETAEWRDIFVMLEGQQQAFLRNESRFRSPAYPWPRDPLHTWSRAWEYPYVYHHLAGWRRQWHGGDMPHVADVGSGVTFFPFTVANLGCNVICTDIDPVCETDLRRAVRVVATEPGSVDFRITRDARLPFADGELDAAYCISVLEHIPEFEQTVSEIARIVRPHGLFLLTVDLDLSGSGELSAARHHDLLACLDMYFDGVASRRCTPAVQQLTSRTGPYPMKQFGPAGKMWFRTKQTVRSLFDLRPDCLTEFYLAVEGLALQRRGSVG